MIKSLTILIASFIFFSASYAQVFELPSGQTITKVIEQKDAYLVFGKTEIFKLQKRNKELVKIAQSPSEILDAAYYNDTVWIGTKTGLFYNTPVKSEFTNVPFVNKKEQAVSIVFKNVYGTTYAGVEAYGLYKRTKAGLEIEAGYLPLNCAASTNDSSIWLGTNSGLNQYKNERWIRYNEEGIANYEIPDNIIDRLIVDEKNTLWIICSEGLSYYESGPNEHAHSHMPSSKFIGRPGNKVYDVSYLKDMGYLFLTDMGTLFLPMEKGEAHLHEFEHPEDDKVENHKSLRNLALSANAKGVTAPKGIIQSLNKKDLLIFDSTKLEFVSKKALLKKLSTTI